MKKFAVTIMILVIGALFSNTLNAQCPMCKTALSSNADGKHKRLVGNGINKGILFLLTAPYVLIGTAGLVWYKNQRKHRDV